MQTTRTPYSISFMATVLLLLLFACHSTVANAAVALGATRVIYPANQKQVLLPVTNNDPASVYLIQSWIENAGDQKDTQFVITPPLFSMQGKKENTLRIINATNHQLPGDRESLFWVNVKAIPAMEKDQKNENTLQLAIISRIKMFYRPTNLAMAPEEAPAMLRFRRSFTLNVPFSHWMRTDSQSAFRNSNASYSMSNDLKGGMTNLSGVYGTLLPDNNLNYSVQVGNTHGGNTSSGTSGYSSLNYRGAYGNTNVGYSRNGDSSQIYYGMSGGIIAHADGITFGQPLGDTMVLVKAPGADNVKIENQTGIHTDWRGYAILPFATEYRENRVALNANSLADNVELDETVVTVIPTHGAIARATFNAQIGGKVLMTLKYGNKSVPFGAIVTHGENKNGSIVAENGQVYLTGLPQSGKLQVSWGNDKNSNCIVDYKLPEVSPGTLLNQQTAICR
nr:fimbria/pilus outer membrane usher protein [Escherichia coli]